MGEGKNGRGQENRGQKGVAWVMETKKDAERAG